MKTIRAAVHTLDDGPIFILFAMVSRAMAGEPQVVPGTIGLVYPDLTEVVSRLKGERFDALDGTKFTWQKRSDGALEVTCPYGERRGEPPADMSCHN